MEISTMTRTQRLLVGFSVFFLACVSLQAQSTSSVWEQLALHSKHLDKGTVYYEKVFEPNLPFFEKAYSELLSALEKNKLVHAKRDALLAEIDDILGIQDPDTEKQKKLWAFIVEAFSSVEDMTFCLIRQRTIKDYLREGGTLPDFTYDKTNDEVAYNLNISGSTKGDPVKHLELACPIESEQTLEKNVGALFRMLSEVTCQDMVGTAIHEIVEISLLQHIRPTGSYWRWFSDGFANAITYDVLKKHFSVQTADAFSKRFETDEYETLKKEINLQYWMSGKFCLLLQDVPTEAGQQLNLARYAYATLEARRLIDNHGIDCVRTILDDIKSKPARTSKDLLATIQHVTGENIQGRLDQYQTFQTREDGLKKYAPALGKAAENKDLESILFNLFRLHDLRLPSEPMQILHDCRYAAKLLFRMGNEPDADAVMQHCVKFFSNPGFPQGNQVASEAFIVYALETGKPLKAKQHAEELLKSHPDHVNALTVQMLAFMKKRQLKEAQNAARKVVDLSTNKESQHYKVASSILAFNPNQPNSKATD